MQTHMLLGVNHNVVSMVRDRMDEARARYVEDHECEIEFGGSNRWLEVEADESTFRKQIHVVEDPETQSRQHGSNGSGWSNEGSQRRW